MKRVVSSLVLLPLLILVYMRGLPLYIGGVVLVSMALNEFYNAFDNLSIRPIKEIGYVYSILLLFINYTSVDVYLELMAVFFMLLLGMLYVFAGKRNVVDVMITIFGIVYIAISINYIIVVADRLHDGYLYIWMIFIISFATDIFAYLVGKNFGKNKLIPSVSPNKTVEGSLGGIAGSVVFGTLFAAIFGLPVIFSLIISLFGSIVAQIGDLTASSIKRYAGIKDYGNLIPGHGGVLDRFDSVVFVAPFVYFSILILDIITVL